LTKFYQNANIFFLLFIYLDRLHCHH